MHQTRKVRRRVSDGSSGRVRHVGYGAGGVDRRRHANAENRLRSATCGRPASPAAGPGRAARASKLCSAVSARACAQLPHLRRNGPASRLDERRC